MGQPSRANIRPGRPIVTMPRGTDILTTSSGSLGLLGLGRLRGLPAFLVSAAFGVAGWPLALRISAMAFLRIAARLSYHCLSPALGLTIRTSWT